MQQLEAQQAVDTAAAVRQTSEDLELITRERDEALREVQHLRKALKKKEQQYIDSSEEVKRIRKVIFIVRRIKYGRYYLSLRA